MATKEDKCQIPLIQRIIFILAGISNFFLGYAIYFCIKDDKDKVEIAKRIKVGADFAFGVSLLYGIIYVIVKLVKLFIL